MTDAGSPGPRPLDPAARLKAIAVLAIFFVLAAGLALERTVFRGDGSARARPAPKSVWTDRSGSRVTLEDFRGKYVLLNFWATWCPPCVEEVPSLERLAERLATSRPDILVVAPSVDEDGWKVVDPFLRKMGADSFRVVLDTGKSASKFGTRKLPETWLIAPDGTIMDPKDAPGVSVRGSRFVGSQRWDAPALAAWFEALPPVAAEAASGSGPRAHAAGDGAP